MISATDLRNGMTIRIDGEVYLLTECEHVKPGKGTAFSRIRLKHIHSGLPIPNFPFFYISFLSLHVRFHPTKSIYLLNLHTQNSSITVSPNDLNSDIAGKYKGTSSSLIVSPTSCCG